MIKKSRSHSRTALKSPLLGFLVVMYCLFAASSASAINMISLDCGLPSVNAGEQFTMDIVMDFSESTGGGGLELSLDPSVSFVAFEFDTGFTGNFGLLAPTSGGTTSPLEIAFGFFSASPPWGWVGQQTIGQITLQALTAGAVASVSAGPSLFNPGPFYGFVDVNQPMDVQFGSASVTITPEPSTALLMGLGLVGLSMRSGNRSSRSGRDKTGV